MFFCNVVVSVTVKLICNRLQFDLTAPNILKMNLCDKPVKEHVAALSRYLGEDIIVSEGVFRKSTKKDYIGTSMRHIGRPPTLY